MVTIKDVADRAGVNASTVSRALKDSSAISQKTKEKVKKAMQELGYIPNVAAQMLASGLTYCLGVVLPPLTKPDRVSQPFFMEILTTINTEAKKHDFTVAIATSHSMEGLAENVALMYRQKRVDGFIVLYSEQDDPVRAYLMANQIPFVVVGTPEGYENEITYIDNDNQLMAKTAVNYLYENGHRHLLFVTDDQESKVYLERYTGYFLEAKKLGLTVYDSMLFERHAPEQLDAFINKVSQEQITGLVVIDDMLSVRVMQFLSFYQLKVPDDVSIVSFNNSTYAKMIHPYLSTFDINIANLGRTSLSRLLEKIKEPDRATEKLTVPFVLKKRESVRNITKKQ